VDGFISAQALCEGGDFAVASQLEGHHSELGRPLKSEGANTKDTNDTKVRKARVARFKS